MPTVPTGLPTWARGRRAVHYGGAPDKLDDTRESTLTYAAMFYAMLQGGAGSAYTKDRSGLVHIENLAVARQDGARFRAAEKLRNNSLPGTSHERLGYWAMVLAVDVLPGDNDHDVRLRCAAKYRLGDGPTIQNQDAAIEELLGTAYVRTWRFEGADLANPPEPTFWPTITPGSSDLDLGGGAWLSARAHLVVQVTQPAGIGVSEFTELMNVHLFRLLDATAPSHATFNWGVDDDDDGFTLDLDLLDWHLMTP